MVGVFNIYPLEHTSTAHCYLILTYLLKYSIHHKTGRTGHYLKIHIFKASSEIYGRDKQTMINTLHLLLPPQYFSYIMLG